MLRTMDWDMPLLKKITIELQFIKNGKTLFIAPTWVGCVGVFTVHIPNKYSMAINYRRTKSIGYLAIIQNIYRTISMSWPISYLIRRVAELGSDYDIAVETLRKSSLVSPCYITMFNPNGKSCVITRDVDESELYVMNDNSSDSKFIIQTNRDDNCKNNKISINSEDILYSKKRYEKASSIIKKCNWTSEEELFKELLIPPIVNEETVYICMIECNGIRTVV